MDGLWSGWTQHDKDAVAAAFPSGGWSDNNEGLFFIDLDSYMSNFSVTQINQDTSNWNLGYFLMHDDPQSTDLATTDCTGCTKHMIEITNTGAPQDMWVGAHVWQARGYGPGCFGFSAG